MYYPGSTSNCTYSLLWGSFEFVLPGYHSENWVTLLVLQYRQNKELSEDERKLLCVFVLRLARCALSRNTDSLSENYTVLCTSLEGWKRYKTNPEIRCWIGGKAVQKIKFYFFIFRLKGPINWRPLVSMSEVFSLPFLKQKTFLHSHGTGHCLLSLQFNY